MKEELIVKQQTLANIDAAVTENSVGLEMCRKQLNETLATQQQLTEKVKQIAATKSGLVDKLVQHYSQMAHQSNRTSCIIAYVANKEKAMERVVAS